ncbi:hypothetical protein BD769DRAFT_1640618 [Suillus cothurnatus]|nr:hypothetical protein BD769DRAFT_1640618 [Suillus cothurnatus]
MFTTSWYLPFVGVGMTAYDALHVSNQCASTVEGYIIHVICIVAAESLLVVRTWAFWQKSKRLLIGLLVYIVLSVAGAITVDLIPTMLIPGEEPPPGTCYFEGIRSAAVVYMFLVVFESVMLILTVYKRFHNYKDCQRNYSNPIPRWHILHVVHPRKLSHLPMLSVKVHFQAPIAICLIPSQSQRPGVTNSIPPSTKQRTCPRTVHIKYLQPSSTSMSGMGITNEV